MNLVEEYNKMYDNLPEKIDYGGMTPEMALKIVSLEEDIKNTKAMYDNLGGILSYLRYHTFEDNGEMIEQNMVDMINYSKLLVDNALRIWKQCVSLQA